MNEYKTAMQKVKATVDNDVAKATEDRGVIVLLTGDGKGKSTSAFGTVIRALGHGQSCAVMQFVKGKWPCGERDFLEAHTDVPVHVMGTGFTWETQDRAVDQAAFDATWKRAEGYLNNPNVDLVVLDELTYAVTFDWIKEADLLRALASRPRQQSVIITGRNASTGLIDLADTVSEISLRKHAFNAGIRARAGVEW